MFNQLGEIQEDLEYLRQSLEGEFIYVRSMLDQAISEDERERWMASAGQLSEQLANLGTKTGTVASSLLSSIGITEESPIYPPVLRSGFDPQTRWPMLAIVGVGILVLIRGGMIKEKKYRKGKRVKR